MRKTTVHCLIALVMLLSIATVTNVHAHHSGLYTTLDVINTLAHVTDVAMPRRVVVQQPVVQPVVQPVYQQPVVQPVYQQPIVQPVYQQPVVQPVVQQPVVQPVVQPVYQQPVYQQPVVQPVVTPAPIVTSPVMAAPIVQPVVPAPVVVSPTVVFPRYSPIYPYYRPGNWHRPFFWGLWGGGHHRGQHRGPNPPHR